MHAEATSSAARSEADRAPNDCVDVAITWEFVAPGSPYIDHSSVTPCRRHHRSRSFSSGAAALSCDGDLPASGKGNMFNVGDLRGVLAHADVLEALGHSPALFFDPNTASTIRVTVGDRQIHVTGGSVAGPVAPRGVASAIALLRGIDAVFENNNLNCRQLANTR